MKYFSEIDYKKLLRGYYEVECLPKDISLESTVPGFAYNILNILGLLYRPIVDEYFLENRGKKPVWPGGKSFAVCLTHDVDVVSFISIRQTLRAINRDLFKGKSSSRGVKNTAKMVLELSRLVKMFNRKDPLHCFEKWLSVEEEIGAHSTFFFWPGISSITKLHRTDCLYELSDSVFFDGQKCRIEEMIKEIDRRGWEIGLHPSWYSFNNISEMKRQKERIEKVVNHDIVSVRQHHLHFDIRITPYIQSEAGFKYDSSLGFNDNVGFRFGTCYPWKIYNLKANAELPIIEIPLIVQDNALLREYKGLRLDEKTAFEYVVMIANGVEKVGGILTLLWHPNRIIWQDWWNLYIKILGYLQKEDPWFASVREIGEWWQKSKASV